jgi:hypothetical protein
MVLVAVACAGAAIGLWIRGRWGQRLAVGILTINLLGDTLNAVLRGDWRALTFLRPEAPSSMRMLGGTVQGIH